MSDTSFSSSIPSGEITDYVKAFERLTEAAQRVEAHELDGGTPQVLDPIEREGLSEREAEAEVEREPVESEPVELEPVELEAAGPEPEEIEEGEEEGDDVEFVPVAADVLVFEATSICQKLEDAGVRFAVEDDSVVEGNLGVPRYGRAGMNTRMCIYVHPDDVVRAEPIIASVLKILP